MIKFHKRKIFIIFFSLFVLFFLIYLILFALKQNINLFYTPEEIFFVKDIPYKKVRIGGIVQEGSIKRIQDLYIEFFITDYKHSICVKYRGILPDLFREHQGVVILGYLIDKKTFIAEQILAKHDEKYIPAELSSISHKN